MPGPCSPTVAELKEWTDQAKVIKALEWFIDPKRQLIVEVPDEDRRKVQSLISSIPTTTADLTHPDWPQVERQLQEGARGRQGNGEGKGEEEDDDDEEEEEEEGDKDKEEVAAVAPMGLRKGEKKNWFDLRKANRDFKNLRKGKLKKGHLAVVQWDNPKMPEEFFLDIGVLQSAVKLDQKRCRLTVEWKVNARRKNANAPVDFNKPFTKYVPANPKSRKSSGVRRSRRRKKATTRTAEKGEGPAKKGAGDWIQTLEPGSFIVFWSGPEADLLDDKGNVHQEKKRMLSFIDGFPLRLKGKKLVPKEPADSAENNKKKARGGHSDTDEELVDITDDKEAGEDKDNGVEHKDAAYEWFKKAALDLFEHPSRREVPTAEFLRLKDQNGDIFRMQTVGDFLDQLQDSNEVLLRDETVESVY